MVLGAIGFAFVRTDDEAWRKDNARFGGLPLDQIGSQCWFFRIPGFRGVSVIVGLLLGLAFVLSGLGWLAP